MMGKTLLKKLTGSVNKTIKQEAMKSRKFEIKGVGEILLERSVRAKHISLSVRPFIGSKPEIKRKIRFHLFRRLIGPKSFINRFKPLLLVGVLFI
ncbi:MAG: hypothetical protein JRE64_00940 [Deltaproteobacteria bacterium]|nr:hypothetical protein [Deltaproteobacteria bacterium]